MVGNIDIPALERDRDQLFAEAMSEYKFGACDLYLPPDLEAEAKAIAAKREKIDPLADTLSTIYRDVLRMRRPARDGTSVVTTDGRPVTGLAIDAGILLTKGEEAEPFAMVGADGVVWVASKYVGELVPPGRKNDGPGIGAAMRSLGWNSVEDRRTGNKRRGWIFTVEDPTL